ncbi:hypothetical protein V5O48_017151 [Marasmius crinis-equi]|uniref:F-box domain-containing protein n=1 Tax=Marasmius crinis-equi TaxID=585013 RepID=A0ABR3EPX5_9AGAR
MSPETNSPAIEIVPSPIPSARIAEIAQVGMLTSSDKEIITRFLNECDTEAKKCRARIHKHKSAVLALEQQEKGVRKAMVKYQSLLSPIHKVPTEILARIFSMRTEGQWGDGLEVHAAPVLSSVSQRWRNVVLSTPQLWSSFSIGPQLWTCPALASKVEIFLERSNETPLSIALSINVGTIAPNIPALRAIIRQSSRWSRLRIDNNPAILFASGVLESLRGKLPLLENLTIKHPTHYALPDPQYTVRRLETEAEACVLLLGGTCTAVEELDISTADPKEYDGRNIVSNTVHTLTLRELLDTELTFLLDSFTFPNLTTLNLRSSWSDDINPLISFLRRSACTLTSLLLRGAKLTDEQAVALFRSMPSLKSLTVEPEYVRFTREGITGGTILTPSFFRLLSVQHDRTLNPNQILPNLEELTLHFIIVPDEKDLREMLESRWITEPVYAKIVGAKCLRSVNIVDMRKVAHLEGAGVEDPDNEKEPIFPSLRTMRDRAMRINFYRPAYVENPQFT